METPLPGVGIDTTLQLPPEVERLAHALSARHGRVTVRRERAGLQMYMACPSCLRRDGRRELSKRHLTVNPDRNLGTGKYAGMFGTYDSDNCGMCMKESVPYKLTDLLSMPPLAERGIADAPTGITRPAAGRCVIPDANGNLIPDHPGEVVSLLDLPEEHPAITYLKSRRYNIESLVTQFRAGFCVKEAFENPAVDRYYSRLPRGFRNTPQNRIIFYADVQGVQKGWQARVVECVHEGIKYYLHPYENTWVPCESKVDGKWTALPYMFEGTDLDWNMQKYKTAFSASRNEMVTGWDAALLWNVRNRIGKPKIVIATEGPSDAGRFGPPAVALLGRYLAPEQVRMMKDNFDIVIFARQNDKASEALEVEFSRAFLGRCNYAPVFPIGIGTKDFGEQDDALAWATLNTVLKRMFNTTIDK